MKTRKELLLDIKYEILKDLEFVEEGLALWGKPITDKMPDLDKKEESPEKSKT